MHAEHPITPDENEPKQWKVFIVDNHSVLRKQLAGLIQRDAHLKICGEADALTALPLIREHEPDLVILDVSSERSQGFDLLEQLHTLCPKVRVLALSLHDGRKHTRRILQAGATGYLTKQEAAVNILPIIQIILESQAHINP